MRVPEVDVLRIAARGQHDADVRWALASTRKPAGIPSDDAAISSSAQVASQPRQHTCASGSPRRTLNSMTFGPSAVSIKPT